MTYLSEQSPKLEITLSGIFLPMRFSPMHLGRVGLIAPEEVLSSEIDFAFNEVVATKTELARITCSGDLLTVSVQNPLKFDAAVDLIVAQGASISDEQPAISAVTRISVSRSSRFNIAHTSDSAPLIALAKTELLPFLTVTGLDYISFEVSAEPFGAQKAYVGIGASRKASFYLRTLVEWSDDPGEATESQFMDSTTQAGNTMLLEFGRKWPGHLQGLEEILRQTGNSLLQGFDRRD